MGSSSKSSVKTPGSVQSASESLALFDKQTPEELFLYRVFFAKLI